MGTPTGRPQVLTLESEHLGDQIRHGSSGQFWVTPGWGGGRAGAASNLGPEQTWLAPQELIPLIAGTPSPPHLPDPSPPSPPRMQGTRLPVCCPWPV